MQTGVPAIWVSGQLLDPWLQYGGLWVSGYSNERWPPAMEPVPLLPARVQHEHGVIAASAESQLKFALELQERWTVRAAQCVFSFADPGDGRAGRRQPAGTRSCPASGVRRAGGSAAALARAARRRAGARAMHRRTRPALCAAERTRGVATLRAQSRCAFRGFAETRLKIDPLEKPVPGFNERERGELLHHALEHVWSVLRGSDALHSLTPEAQWQLLEDAVTRALDHARRMRDPGPRWRLGSGRACTVCWANGWTWNVSASPSTLSTWSKARKSPATPASSSRCVWTGWIDWQDGARVLIDYKSGMAAADWRGERPDNPQLPLYALLRPEALVAVAYGKVNIGDAGFVAETERGGIFRPHGRKSSLEGLPSFGALLDLWSGPH